MIPSVLAKIAASVEKRLAERKALLPEAVLRTLLPKARVPHAFEAPFLAPGIHTIAEVKFRSPALGVLDESGEALAVTIAGSYLKGGATAISVLTEEDHFQGSAEYLKAIRIAFPDARLLMKDFVVSEYQIMEALINGADAVLLIVSLLGAERTQELFRFAKSLKLSVLVEVHDELELTQAIDLDASLIGVNNRNLKTLEVSLENSFRMASLIIPGRTFISESGISSSDDLRKLSQAGFRGFLVGSTLMSSPNPGERLQALVAEAQ